MLGRVHFLIFDQKPTHQPRVEASDTLRRPEAISTNDLKTAIASGQVQAHVKDLGPVLTRGERQNFDAITGEIYQIVAQLEGNAQYFAGQDVGRGHIETNGEKTAEKEATQETGHGGVLSGW